MHKEFEVHKLDEHGLSKARTIALLFDELLKNLESIIPLGRELSITKTKLEEACFFAKKGLAESLAGSGTLLSPSFSTGCGKALSPKLRDSINSTGPVC